MARWHSRPYCVGAVDGTFPWARVSTGGGGQGIFTTSARPTMMC